MSVVCLLSSQIKVLDGEDEYYESLSAVESTPEDDSFLSSPSPPSRDVSFAQSWISPILLTNTGKSIFLLISSCS